MTPPKLLFATFSILFFSCGQPETTTAPETKSDSTTGKTVEIKKETPSLRDTMVQILWRENRYNEDLKDSVYTIIMNEDYCKSITGPEKAAVGYVATFIGNDCWWEGEYSDKRDNLKCKILTALDLGYQCSDKHLGFLRKWFGNDKKALEELDGCGTMPYTATIQNTFDEIKLTIKGDSILVWFNATGANMREGESWSWTQTDHFVVDHDKISLVKTDKSKVTRENFKMGE